MTLHALTRLKNCTLCRCSHGNSRILKTILNHENKNIPQVEHQQTFERNLRFIYRCPNCMMKIDFTVFESEPHKCDNCEYIYNFDINIRTEQVFIGEQEQTEFWEQFCKLLEIEKYCGVFKYMSRCGKKTYTKNDRNMLAYISRR